MIPLGVLGSARVAAAAGPLVADYVSYGATGGATTYTWTGLALGAEAPDRTIIVVVTAQTNGGGEALSALTVGGVSATLDVTASGVYSDIRTYFCHVALPSGVTGDVTLTLSASWKNAAVHLYRVTGPAVAYHSHQRTTTSGASLTCSTVAGGLIIGAAVGMDDPSYTWTGLTEDHEVLAGFRRSVAHAETPNAGTLAVSATFGTFAANVSTTYQPD